MGRADHRRRVPGWGEGPHAVTAWKADELARIGRATELQITSRRGDGSLRPYVTIWVVRSGDDLYVRSAYGQTTGGSSGPCLPARDESAPAASRETSRSRIWVATCTPTSTRPTTRSTTATARASSPRWCRPRRSGQPSGSCLDRRVAWVRRGRQRRLARVVAPSRPRRALGRVRRRRGAWTRTRCALRSVSWGTPAHQPRYVPSRRPLAQWSTHS